MIFGRAFLWSLSFRGVVLEFFPLAAEVAGFSGFSRFLVFFTRISECEGHFAQKSSTL